ncbi:hypothetical protein NPIL_151291 [Nephila pilipes]|uniref:Uncharacterized protein n=1 Tax=Nephila pilipes TaxID=299642 RepID=A0A8X6N7K4_NEPPI|nr:hypothetical protein NPIL_151291 [Nephila pilipes]
MDSEYDNLRSRNVLSQTPPELHAFHSEPTLMKLSEAKASEKLKAINSISHNEILLRIWASGLQQHSYVEINGP